MMIQNFLISIFVALQVGVSYAVEIQHFPPEHPALVNPVWLRDAVQVQITPRGQRLFSEDLVQILSNLSIVVNENFFPEFNYVSPEPISIDQLAQDQPEQFRILVQVRQFFRQYLKGIQFNDFKPSIRLGPSEYVAQFDRLSLVTDETLMRSLGKTDGAILAIELSITSLKALTDRIDFKDLGNPWMGQVSITNPTLQIGQQNSPLKVRMPFYVKADGKGGLFFEALKIEENLDVVPIEFGYQKFVLPEFEFKIVDQPEAYRVSVNEPEFKKLVDEQLPQGLKLIRQYVRGYLQNEFPKILNQQVQAGLKEDLEQLQSVPAANSSADDQRPPLTLGLRLTDLSLKDSQVLIKLAAFAEDTSIVKATPFWDGSEARGKPVFHHLNSSDYDIGISLDRALINRLIHLSFNRGNFKALTTCPGGPTVELVNAPSLDFARSHHDQENEGALIDFHIDAQVDAPPEHTGGLFDPLRKKIRLTMKYQALIRPIRPGSAALGIYMLGPDLKTLHVHDSSLTLIGKMFKNKVISTIREILSSESDCGSDGPLAEFELINSLWGVPLEYSTLKMETQGQLMLYMNYKGRSYPSREGL